MIRNFVLGLTIACAGICGVAAYTAKKQSKRRRVLTALSMTLTVFSGVLIFLRIHSDEPDFVGTDPEETAAYDDGFWRGYNGAKQQAAAAPAQTIAAGNNLSPGLQALIPTNSPPVRATSTSASIVPTALAPAPAAAPAGSSTSEPSISPSSSTTRSVTNILTPREVAQQRAAADQAAAQVAAAQAAAAQAAAQAAVHVTTQAAAPIATGRPSSGSLPLPLQAGTTAAATNTAAPPSPVAFGSVQRSNGGYGSAYSPAIGTDN
jgi:hypothetical protein